LPKSLVVDASVAVKWLLAEDHSDEALAMLADGNAFKVQLVVPPGFTGEVLNALYQQERRNALLSVDVDEALERFDAVPYQLAASARFLDDALAIARRFSLGATYDGQYLALAQAFGVEFWTADQRLIRAVAPSFPLIRWIGDYTSVDDTSD
jgi:predicted nucleic acid-binding protein